MKYETLSKLTWIFMVIFAAVALVASAGIIYAIFHFISKWW